MSKVRVATAWLCGCSGCHMSLLNVDEEIIELAKGIEFVMSPIVDMKEFDRCDLAIVEGAVSDSENLEVLRDIRGKCKELVALGDCAVFGGMTSMRNLFDKQSVLERGFVETETTTVGKVPAGEEVPELLDRARPLDAFVKVDHYIPGCPPDAKVIAYVVKRLMKGDEAKLPPEMIHFDSSRKPRRSGL